MEPRLKWLASYPKSGNTWVRILLEGYLLGVEPDLNDMRLIKGDNIESYHNVGLKMKGPLVTASERLVALFRYIESGNPFSIYKTHVANMHVDGIPLFPLRLTAPSVYLVRDPKDVCLSYMRHLGENFEFVSKFMQQDKAAIMNEKLEQFLSTWDKHVQSWANHAEFSVLVVKYEDLLVDTFTHFKAILEQYNIPINEERIHNAIEWANFARLQKKEKEEGFRERSEFADSFFTTGKSGNWKDMDLTFPDFGESAKQFGYT